MLQGFLERQAHAAHVAAARAAHGVGQRFDVLALDRRPAFLAEGALDLGLRRQRMEQGLHEAEPGLAPLADELERGQVHLVRAHLAVADDAVARELKTGDAKVDYLHSSYFWRKRCSGTLVRRELRSDGRSVEDAPAVISVRTSCGHRRRTAGRPCDIPGCFE